MAKFFSGGELSLIAEKLAFCDYGYRACEKEFWTEKLIRALLNVEARFEL